MLDWFISESPSSSGTLIIFHIYFFELPSKVKKKCSPKVSDFYSRSLGKGKGKGAQAQENEPALEFHPPSSQQGLRTAAVLAKAL